MHPHPLFPSRTSPAVKRLKGVRNHLSDFSADPGPLLDSKTIGRPCNAASSPQMSHYKFRTPFIYLRSHGSVLLRSLRGLASPFIEFHLSKMHRPPLLIAAVLVSAAGFAADPELAAIGSWRQGGGTGC